MGKSPKKVTRRSFLKYAGLTAGATVLSACAAPTPQVVEKIVEKEKEVVITATPMAIKKDAPIVIGAPSEDLGLFILLAHTDYPNYFTSRALLGYDFKGGTYDVLPSLAESYEVLDDGYRYRMHLRDNAYYHSGRKYEAEDSVWWLHLQLQEDHPDHYLAKRAQSRARNVDHAEAVDKNTLDLYLKSVTPYMPDWLTSWHEYAPHNPETVKALGEAMVDKEDNLGPYKLLDWQKGNRIVLERFDQYWDPAEGKAGQMIFRPITEPAAMIAALEAGEIDWMGDVPVEEALRLATMDGINVVQRKSLWVWYITLDVRKPPLDDVRVRQALNYAVNKEVLIRDILSGAGQRSYGPLGPEFGPYYAKDVVRHYDYDPDKARELLAEAGYPNGFDEIDGERAVLHTYTGRVGAQKPIEMCEFIQAQWKDVGVDVEISVLDFGAHEEKRVAGDFAMAVRGWTPSSADPDGLMVQNFHTDYIPPNGRNVTFLSDPEIDSLIDKAMTTVDMPVRIQAMLDAQKRIVELAPWVFVDHETSYEAYSDKIRDYKAWPGGRAAGMAWAWKEM